MKNPNENCPVSFLCGTGTHYISIAVLVLLVLDCVIMGLNRSTQNDIVKIQQEIAGKATKLQQNQVFANIYQNLVQSLATAAIVKKDEQVKALLTQNNIKVSPKPPAGSTPAALPNPAPAPAPAAAPAQ